MYQDLGDSNSNLYTVMEAHGPVTLSQCLHRIFVRINWRKGFGPIGEKSRVWISKIKFKKQPNILGASTAGFDRGISVGSLVSLLLTLCLCPKKLSTGALEKSTVTICILSLNFPNAYEKSCRNIKSYPENLMSLKHQEANLQKVLDIFLTY